MAGRRDFERYKIADTVKSEGVFIKKCVGTDSEEANDQHVCEDCKCDKENCHKELFDGYCTAHVIRQFRLFPTAMTRNEAIRVFVKKYNSALHFWRYSKHHILTKRPFEIPPPCLERQMHSCADMIEKSHKMWVAPDETLGEDNIFPNTNRDVNDDFREWRESSMDFDGLEMDDF